jgi:elongation factor Ts
VNSLKFHTSVVPFAAASAAKSDLAKLRKKTGYSLSICKKALSETNNDLAEAEVWLKGQAQAQGWAKAQKLQGRNTSQGLIGLTIQGNKAALVELNCETDFVARNQKFKSILENVANTCLNSTTPSNSDDSFNKIDIPRDEISKLKIADGSSLADLVALNIGQIGENMALGDATFIQAASGISLAGLSHPATDVSGSSLMYGRYIALMAYTKADKGESVLPEGLVEEKIPSQICQHIIGMNPTSVKNEEDKENSLMHQKFLIDESVTIEELCSATGLNIIDFTRREIGRQ